MDKKERNGVRAGIVDRRLVQGWAEIAAFYVDRVLGFNRKPPVVGRKFDNHFLFAFDNSFRNLQLRNKETFEIPLALISWLDNIHGAVPDWKEVGKVLVMEGDITNTTSIKSLLEISDTIVFDFLVDDHDKHNTQNWKQWKAGADEYMLFWDSGLAWQHGPEGQTDCIDLLCGPKEWRIAEPEFEEKKCRHICRFNEKTVRTLKAMSPKKGPTFGQILKEALKADELYPVFNYGEFYALKHSKEQSNIVHFEAENFFDGMDLKISQFLDHVGKCAKKYGEKNVLITE